MVDINDYNLNLSRDDDEAYANGLWDMANDILKQHTSITDELLCDIYYALADLRDKLKQRSKLCIK